ncbi:MAG: asparagine synthase-related protein [Actinomycetes bacterium]
MIRSWARLVVHELDLAPDPPLREKDLMRPVADRPVADRSRHATDAAWVEPFLAFGFVPRLDVADPLSLLSSWSRVPPRSEDDVCASELVREGVRALQSALEECASGHDSGDQVVFLSGGLDSRVILGGLLGLFDTSEIVAATFGLPGERDYDFASAVARRAGVRHVILETFSADWTTEGLVESARARRVPSPAVFGQRYLSYVLHQQIGPRNLFWDGLCGDMVGGKRLSPRPSPSSWDEAGDEFLQVHLHPRWRTLVRPDFDPTAFVPDTPFCSVDLMPYRDQLVFGIRQRCATSTRLLRDFPIRTPFLTRPWLDFMFTVPQAYRHEQYLYREIQKVAFPRLASLPTTALHGRPLMEGPVSRIVRKLDDEARGMASRLGLPVEYSSEDKSRANFAIRSSSRQSGPIRGLVRDNLTDLAARGLVDWLDVEAFIPGAVPCEQTDESVVVRLLNLELNLKAAELPS